MLQLAHRLLGLPHTFRRRVHLAAEEVGILALIVFFLVDTLGNGAYQLAILSLLGTMLIGLWLVWPVSDRWTEDDVISQNALADVVATLNSSRN